MWKHYLKAIPPWVMTKLTGHARYKPKIEWSHSWTFNVFRVYEQIFWRREGIRAESSVSTCKDGTVVQAFHSWEAAIMASEFFIRDLFKFRAIVPIKIWIPVLYTPQGIPVFASPYLFAIATDTTAQGQIVGGGTTLSVAQNVSGSNRIIITGFLTFSASGDIVSTIKYHSVSETRLNIKTLGGTGSQRIYFYYLIAPDTGNNNIDVTLSSGASFNIAYMVSASYSGVSQTGYPDAQSSGTALTNANIVGTVTTVADNAWPVMLTGSDDDNSATAGAGTTIRIASSGATNPSRLALSDSNGPKTPAGSTSLTVTPSISTASDAYIIASMAPFAAAGPANVKTKDGVTQSTGIKTYMGLALASVKSVEGVV